MKSTHSQRYHVFLLVSLILIGSGIVAWANTYHVQSATLFGFGILLAIQWNVSRTRRVTRKPLQSSETS